MILDSEKSTNCILLFQLLKKNFTNLGNVPTLSVHCCFQHDKISADVQKEDNYIVNADVKRFRYNSYEYKRKFLLINIYHFSG